ncbi:hypothetical protein JHK82_041788 [Glycine max]|nr:hypothetical protein JHK86_041844 [Glycine max]KAG5104818.1 hypothetical protein JHK82_041788 [Glycine max]
MACLHDHSCEDRDCSSNWPLYKHIDLSKGGAVTLTWLNFPAKGYGSNNGFVTQLRFCNIKPSKASHVEASLVAGKPSSVSFSVPEIGGDGSSFLDYGLSEADPEVRAIIDKEKDRQFKSLELVASENFTSRAVMEAVGLIDYDMLEKTATLFRPKLIIAGASAYPRDIDYPRMRKLITSYTHGKIADEVGAFLMMDMAHISGLVAASVLANPFEYCDIVTTTTHKSLRGPRGGMIFFKKDTVHGVDLEPAINNAVFPGLQGGPHNHTIGGLAVCLKYAQSPEFKNYQNQVVANCKALAQQLIEHGYKLVSGGSDNHLVLVDLRPSGLDGARVEKILDMASITLNKNSVPGDKSALVPGGIRIGTPAMTTRGLGEKEFSLIADFIHEGVQICLEAKSLVSGTKLQDFLKFVSSFEFPLGEKISELRRKVEALTTQYPIPGV